MIQLLFTAGCNSTIESSDILPQPTPVRSHIVDTLLMVPFSWFGHFIGGNQMLEVREDLLQHDMSTLHLEGALRTSLSRSSEEYGTRSLRCIIWGT